MSTAAPPRDFGFGEDEHMPVERLRALVAADPESSYERGERPAWDAGIWKQIGELGWAGLAVPESAGGVGGKMVAIAALVEEIGRHALPSPLVATLCAAFALREARTAFADAWLARIADGAAASLAITDARGSWDPEDCGVTARADGADLVLSGAAHFVQDAFKADFFVVSARGPKGLVLCAVPAGAAGSALEQNHIHDLTRDQATLRCDGVRVARADVVSEEASPALRRAWPALLVAVAADLCGTSEWQLQTTVEYAKQRKQFERQIGFFQAVKHPLVNAMIEIDRARSLLYHAACCIDTSDEKAEAAARMAKSAASDAGAFISDRSVQLHGGIGFTWECDVHLFFKRSLHNQTLYGDGAHQRKLLAETLIGRIGG